MKNSFGNNIILTIFGESHGTSTGVVIDGLTPGLDVDTEYISHLLTLRRPSGNISTQRQEKDEFVIQMFVNRDGLDQPLRMFFALVYLP